MLFNKSGINKASLRFTCIIQFWLLWYIVVYHHCLSDQDNGRIQKVQNFFQIRYSKSWMCFAHLNLSTLIGHEKQKKSPSRQSCVQNLLAWLLHKSEVFIFRLLTMVGFKYKLELALFDFTLGHWNVLNFFSILL